MVRASGKELIERAEEIVGKGELTTSLQIHLKYEQGRAPVLEVTHEYINRQAFNVLIERSENNAV